MHHALTDAAKLAALHQIAQALAVPVDAFFASPPAPRSAAQRARQEGCALLDAFAAVTDPERRRACIAFVQGMAGGDDPPDEG